MLSGKVMHTSHLGSRPAAARTRPLPSLSPCLAPTPRAPTVVTSAGRAPSAFNLYTKERYAAIKGQLESQKKDAKLADVTAIIRKEWSSLDDKKKQPYVSESQKRKEQVASARAEEKKNAGPTKPPSSYAVFTKEKFPEAKAKLPPGAKLPEIVKMISDMWKNLPAEEKARRTADARAKTDAYKAAKAAHEAK